MRLRNREAPEITLSQRILGAVDLAIDFATLGEYGLESSPAEGTCGERPGRTTGWEALAQVRRGGCPAAPPPRARREQEREPRRRSHAG